MPKVMKLKAQRYFLPEQYGLFERLKVRVFDGKRPIPTFPIRAQIQTRTACNAECAFCPNTTVGDALSQGEMDWDLYTKIVDEMCEHEIDEIHPFLMNEPLWDKELPKKIRYLADRRKPGSKMKIKINTNASFLTDDVAKQLIESGLDKINISFHGIRPEVYEFNMGNLKFEPMIKKVLRFKQLLTKASKPKPKLHITMVKTKDIVDDKKNIRAFWKSHGIGCNFRPLGNRNNKEVEMKGINWDDWHAYTWCRRPFTQIYILYNGDCVLCCCDWNRTTTLGNLRHKTIAEVWNSPAYKRVRENFLLKDRKDLLCGTCLYTR